MDGDDQQLGKQTSSESMARNRNKKKSKSTSFSAQEKNDSIHLPAASIDILKRLLMERDARANAFSRSCSSASCAKLSTDEILKMARESLIQKKSLDVASILFGCSSDDPNSCLSPDQKSDDFELAKLLQGAALLLSKREFEKAKWWLNICQSRISPAGNSLHRIVSYFSAALLERIARELGEKAVPDAREANLSDIAVEDPVRNLQPELIKSYQLLPFCQVTDFTAIQALVDNVASARRVHLVDLGMKTASHWPVMMQDLAARHDQLEILKLTAIGTAEDDDIGKMLSSFAETLNIRFEFRLIVSDLKDLKEDMFELSDDEVLAVYSELHLASLLPSPDHLVSLLKTIEKLNPSVMVVIEIEASTDTPIFLDRFDEALSVCAAVFDCLEECLARDNPCRGFIEGGFIWEAVRNVIICEGEERITRHERLNFWRGFLSRFGFVEVALSDTAFLQLDMVLKRNPCRSSCTIDRNGKGIIVGWKKTPIKSLSVWKFQHE